MMQTPHNQKGLALLMLVFLLVLVATGYAVSILDGTDFKQERDRKTIAALAEAKVALIGGVINDDVTVPPYLVNPDLKLTPVIPEGSESGMSGGVDESLIGKVPWRSLGASLIKDGWGECLWYVVSGRFKNNPKTNDALNWDTQGQIDILNENGSLVASNLVALIVSPGPVLEGQSRLSGLNVPRCGGNYDAKNYLDTFIPLNAISGEVNYFSGSVNNREAPNINNKSFVLTNNNFYNDRFIFVTVDEILAPTIRRSDFRDEINNLLIEVETQVTTSLPPFLVSGVKGVGGIDCAIMVNSVFCDNWKEMLLLKESSNLSINMIDTGVAETCSHVIIFGGKKTGGQLRAPSSEKDKPENYLSLSNNTLFNNLAPPPPPSLLSIFDGYSRFDPDNPSRDVMRCIP